MVAAALFFDAEAAALLALLKRMIYTWINKNSFVPQDEERHIYKLQKGEPTMTKLTLEEKQELIRMALAARERGLHALQRLYGGRCPARRGWPHLHRLQRGECRLYPHQLRRADGPVQGCGRGRDQVYRHRRGGLRAGAKSTSRSPRPAASAVRRCSSSAARS